VTEGDALAINAVAARWDGIERIEGDGTLAYCRWVSDALEQALGLRLERISPAEMSAVADDMAARLARLQG
jgi:phage gp37-like protein